MLVKNLNVTNSSIDFKNINIDFSQNGFYLIKGKNGLGKTTIIDSILFSKNCCFFSNQTKANLFYNDKHKLITYISQNIFTSNDSVEQFLIKSYNETNNELINKYLSIFGLDYLKENIKTTLYKSLSGGEKQLLHIIAGLAKENEYVIIDEPTNNLDEDKIQILLQVLNNLKQNHKIIVVSHCELFEQIKDYTILVKNGKVETDTLNNENDELELLSNTKKHNFKIKKNFIFQLVFNKIFILSFLLFIFLSITASSFCYFYLKTNLYYDPPTTGNFIIGRHTGLVDTNNLDYILNRKLDYDPSNKDRTVTYKDLNRLKSIDGIQNIYLINYDYKFKILTEIENQGFSLIPYSIPFDIYKSINDYTDFSFNFKILNGSYPKDQKNEVVLSKKILKDNFGIDENNYLNKEIEIDTNGLVKNYKIVGIIDLDLVIVSFDKNTYLSIYDYDPKTISAFLDSSNLNLDDKITSIIIKTSSDNKERSILDFLTTNYTSLNLSSNYMALFLSNLKNKVFYNHSIIIFSLMYLVIIIIMILLNLKTNKFFLNALTNYENYYLVKNNFKLFYIFLQFLFFIIVFLINTIFNVLFKEALAFRMTIVLVCNLILILLYGLSQLLTLRIKKRNEVRNPGNKD